MNILAGVPSNGGTMPKLPLKNLQSAVILAMPEGVTCQTMTVVGTDQPAREWRLFLGHSLKFTWIIEPAPATRTEVVQTIDQLVQEAYDPG